MLTPQAHHPLSQSIREQRATPGAPGFVISDKPCHPGAGIFFNQNEAVTSICPAIKKSVKTGWAAAPDTGAIQITRDRKGARVIDGEILLNRLLKEPGPGGHAF